MALSNKNPPPLPGDPSSPPITNNNSNRPNGKSWAQVAGSRQRQSLIHQNSERKGTDSSAPSIIRTHHWKPGRNPGSMFFDIGAANITHLQSYKYILEQYPTRVAVVPISQGPRRLVEVNFDVDDPNINIALTNGLKVASSNSLIIPCLAINVKESDLNIVRLSLTRLPLLRESKLLDGLKLSLAKYGSIIDVGIYREQSTQTYMGTGYAILNRSNTKGLEPLTHNIAWDDSMAGYYATWEDMPKWCRYCHSEGHLVGECQILLDRTACYNCKQPGHKAAVCPRGNSGKRQRKLPSPPTESTVPITPPGPTVASPSPVVTPKAAVTTSNSYVALTYEEHWDEVVDEVLAKDSPAGNTQHSMDSTTAATPITIASALFEDTLDPHDEEDLDPLVETTQNDQSLSMDEDDISDGDSLDNMDNRMEDLTGPQDEPLDDRQPSDDQPLTNSTKSKQQQHQAAAPTRTQPKRSAGRPARYTN
ncbi:hypothetical protein [Absidia glauca]|uniref:CCHC-type domain-containing protein n=1 Tax=Absidia glauca TaxID=4829 RepID=A0A163J686_ABSGL|nr:hypothetical protein [Absidia glauca]